MGGERGGWVLYCEVLTGGFGGVGWSRDCSDGWGFGLGWCLDSVLALWELDFLKHSVLIALVGSGRVHRIGMFGFFFCVFFFFFCC